MCQQNQGSLPLPWCGQLLVGQGGEVAPGWFESGLLRRPGQPAAGHQVAGQPLAQPAFQVVDGGAGVPLDKGHWPVSPLGIHQGHHQGLGHRRVFDQGGLNLLGLNVLTAADKLVIQPAADL